jgi:hypothetical protein
MTTAAMVRALVLAMMGGATVPATAPTAAAQGPQGALPRPATRAERTGYAETTPHAEVLAFIDTLSAMGAPISRLRLGTSIEGRELPLLVASRPVVRTPQEARALGRPVAYVQANIHAGEVEGKEAVLALLRDWSFGARPNVLDSLVVLVVPIYNADGNEKLAPQARNRGSQNGPEMIGERANGMGLDLNRDYVKAEAPETQASLAAFAAWDPDLFMDLHTTNGSYHGYALTYSPSLHPASPLTPYVSDTLLPEIRRRVKATSGFEMFPYGNFTSAGGRESNSAGDGTAWVTYDHRQRFGTNYYGLRGKLSILSEAFSHDPFDRRVASTRAFVQTTLSLIAERADEVRSRVAAGTAASRFAGSGPSAGAAARPVPVRARFTSRPDTQPVLMEELERAADSTAVTEPGVPRGVQRTGRIVARRMAVVDRFEPTLTRTPPAFGWALPAEWTDAVALLRRHGVTVQALTRPATVPVEAFTIDSVSMAARPFQGHREATVTGRWGTVTRTLPAGTWVVRTGTPADLLAMQLLEPESDDGLLTWNLFDRALVAGREAPVVRIGGSLAPSDLR